MASFIYSTAGMILILVSACSADFEFNITYQNSTKTGLVCRYGYETVGKYFDVFRNGRQCLTAAHGACAVVVNRGCQCEGEMKLNEVRFTINSPKEYDTVALQCKVLNGVSKEKTINVTANVTPKTSATEPLPATPMPTTKVTDEEPGHGTKTVRQGFTVTPKTSATEPLPATPMPAMKVTDEEPGHGTKTVRHDFTVPMLMVSACVLLALVLGVGVLGYACRVQICWHSTKTPRQETTNPSSLQLDKAGDESRSSNSQDNERPRSSLRIDAETLCNNDSCV